MADPACDICGHEKSMGRCWRLTCPSNGARESFHVVRPAAENDREPPVIPKAQERML